MKESEIEFARECLEECKNLYYDNKYENAILLALRAKVIFEKEHLPKDLCHALNLLGVTYSTFGFENVSIDYYLEGMNIARDNNLIDELSLFHNNLGSDYLDIKDYPQALRLFKEAYEIIEGYDIMPKHEYVLYINLCNVYYAVEDYQNASFFLEKARAMNEKMDEEDRLSFAITESRLEIKLGHIDYVQEMLPKILDSIMAGIAGVSYWPNMKDLAIILTELQDREDALRLIAWIDEDMQRKYGSKIEPQIEIQVIKLKLQFAKAINDQKTYQTLCVQLYELEMAYGDEENHRRAANMDLKIKLYKKEHDWIKIEQMSCYDALTSVSNRYKLEEDSKGLIQSYCQTKKAFTVGLIDVDYFKQVNDYYGHITGDDYLREVASIAEGCLPESGRVYRYGGDEFVILLQTGNQDEVEEFASSLQKRLAERKLKNAGAGEAKNLTVSQGYSISVPAEGTDIWSMIDKADSVLYQAKQGGRDAYCIAGE